MKYKLTDSKDRTQDNTQWGENITNKARKGKPILCTDTVIHYTDHPLLAVLLNPIQASIPNPHLWTFKGRKAVHDGLKGGTKVGTTIKRIPLPKITPNQRVRCAILWALEVYHDKGFERWATQWLNGEDRSRDAAANAANDAAWVATAAAAWVAIADAARLAAINAAWAAAANARAASPDAWAHTVHAYDAWAARAAARAALALPTRRLIQLAEQAIREEVS